MRGSDENTVQSPPRIYGSSHLAGSAVAAHVFNLFSNPKCMNIMVNPCAVIFDKKLFY
jgi:hypothetical protein